jgi:hypothetical protein
MRVLQLPPHPPRGRARDRGPEVRSSGRPSGAEPARASRQRRTSSPARSGSVATSRRSRLVLAPRPPLVPRQRFKVGRCRADAASRLTSCSSTSWWPGPPKRARPATSCLAVALFVTQISRVAFRPACRPGARPLVASIFPTRRSRMGSRGACTATAQGCSLMEDSERWLLRAFRLASAGRFVGSSAPAPRARIA